MRLQHAHAASAALGALVALIAVASPARADGRAFPPQAFASPHMPDQAAVIHYAGGVEYLAIETNIVGEGDRFAWVIPTPSPATVEPVTSGVFPQLRTQMAPTIVHTPMHLWPWFLVGLIVVVAMVHKRYDLIALLLLLAFLASILLAGFGTLGAHGPAAASVTVHDRRVVGSYDTAAISGDSADALTGWLAENGFAVESSVKPVIAAYVAEGWSFVAARLRRPDGAADADGPLTPHPLGLRFAAAAPVYPLRLTGVGNGPLDVDLYVFADRRAEADGFAVERCSRVLATAPDSDERRDGHVMIRHRELARIVGDASVVTHLRGTLGESQMTRDAAISFVPVAAHEPTLYSNRGARVIAINVGVGMLCLALLIGMASDVRERITTIRGKLAAGLVPLALVAGGVVYLALPKTPVTTSTWPALRVQTAIANLATALSSASLDDEHQPMTIDRAREMLPRMIAGQTEYYIPHPTREGNPYTDRPMVEQDSPGNYTLASDGAKLYLVAHALDGGEQRFRFADALDHPAARDRVR